MHSSLHVVLAFKLYYNYKYSKLGEVAQALWIQACILQYAKRFFYTRFFYT